MTRFYIDGDEIDVQDLIFFIDTKHYIETKEAIENNINDYA